MRTVLSGAWQPSMLYRTRKAEIVPIIGRRGTTSVPDFCFRGSGFFSSYIQRTVAQEMS